MVNTLIPIASKNASGEDISKALDGKDNLFQLYYFKMHTHGATARALLSYADANWKDVFPDLAVSALR
jgi:hypothetical protein